MKSPKFLAVTLVAISLGGCAIYPSAGDKQGEVPPQIVIRDDVKIWDNPGAFGPVPQELQSAAESACTSLNTDKLTFEPKGYHAQALNLEGKPFNGGGYYCVPKR